TKARAGVCCRSCRAWRTTPRRCRPLSPARAPYWNAAWPWLPRNATNSAGSPAGTTACRPICRLPERHLEYCLNFERDNVRQMQGYASGEQPDRADVIKLNTNENPYPAGPAVAAALAAIRVEDLRRYPPPTALPLRRELATLHNLEADNVLVTNGGDELLRLLLATFVAPGERIATASPSYSLYDVLAAAHGCEMQGFPLNADWSLPDDLASRMNAAGIKLCFIVNPHAPSGL